MSKATLYSWDSIENEQLNPLLSRKFVTGDQSMFARVVLAKGCIVPRHSHPNEQITFITQGALRFDFDDGTFGYATDGTPVDCVRLASLGLIIAVVGLYGFPSLLRCWACRKLRLSRVRAAFPGLAKSARPGAPPV